jgi:DNA (cytosine-5)-methyltransferase 1
LGRRSAFVRIEGDDLRLFEGFAGGGMARLGFGARWKVILANDVSRMKAECYAVNFGAEHLRVCDVARLTTADVLGVVDCAWMSPPCVGHSEAGNKQGFAEQESRRRSGRACG